MVSNSSNSIEVNNNKKQKISNSMESNAVDKYGLCFPGKFILK